MNLFTHKWLPRFFYKKFDGGKNSGVTGYFLIEWKKFFSIGLLHFKEGSREAYHSHAFPAITWFIKGNVTEEHITGETKEFKASFKPKFTPRSCFHKVFAHTNTWALTFRGPWYDHWAEFNMEKSEYTILTHGREKTLVMTKEFFHLP